MILAIGILLLAMQLPATNPLDVRSFGAVPDDGMDDAAAIQRAISSAREGQVIQFPPGTFEISRTLPLSGGKSLRGATTLKWQGDRIVAESETILKATGEHFIFRFVSGENLNLGNLTFHGRALFTDRPENQMSRGVIIDNCRFALDVKGESSNAIEFTTGLADSKITNCFFDPIKGDNAIYGYNWDNLVIANNHFLNGNEGMHLIAHLDSSKDLLIEQNYFSGIRRMAAEIQGGGVNTIVQDNWYENPVLSTVREENDATFAYSIVADRSRMTKVLRNVSIAPQRPDRIGVRIIFELGGFTFLCEDNHSEGGNHVVAVNGTRATGIVRNNRFTGHREEPRNSNEARAIFRNNGPDVKLTQDLIARGKPGPNRRFPAR